MATNNPFFAAKTRSVAPLTDVADSFAAGTYARPDFSQGRVITASFQNAPSPKLTFGPSYSAKGGEKDRGGKNG